MMRKFVISLAAAGTALAFATPAAAQYFPQPQGYAYGYNNNYGQVRALQARIDSVQRQIQRLDRRNRVSNRSVDRLRDESRSIERRLRNASRYGLNPYEANDINQRIARLEQRVSFAMGRGYGRGGYGYNSGYGGYGQNGYYNGRGDHDGQWDRNRDHDDDRYRDHDRDDDDD